MEYKRIEDNVGFSRIGVPNKIRKGMKSFSNNPEIFYHELDLPIVDQISNWCIFNAYIK